VNPSDIRERVECLSAHWFCQSAAVPEWAGYHFRRLRRHPFRWCVHGNDAGSRGCCFVSYEPVYWVL